MIPAITVLGRHVGLAALMNVLANRKPRSNNEQTVVTRLALQPVLAWLQPHLSGMPPAARIALLTLSGDMLLHYFNYMRDRKSTSFEKEAKLDRLHLDGRLADGVTLNDLSGILGGIGGIAQLVGPLLSMTGVGAPIGMALSAVGGIASGVGGSMAKPGQTGAAPKKTGLAALFGDAYGHPLIGTTMPTSEGIARDVLFSKRAKRAMLAKQMKEGKEFRAETTERTKAMEEQLATMQEEQAYAMEEMLASQQEMMSAMMAQSPQMLMTSDPEQSDLHFSRRRRRTRRAEPPIEEEAGVATLALPVPPESEWGEARDFASRLDAYNARASYYGWPTPGEVLADIVVNMDWVDRPAIIKPDNACCSSCKSDGAQSALDACYDCISDAAFVKHGTLPEGVFHESSWVRATLADLPDGLYGQINTGKRPFEVLINRNVQLPRAQVSFSHEMVHALDDLLKLGLSHDQVHSFATMLTSEVLPGLNALTAAALRK